MTPACFDTGPRTSKRMPLGTCAPSSGHLGGLRLCDSSSPHITCVCCGRFEIFHAATDPTNGQCMRTHSQPWPRVIFAFNTLHTVSVNPAPRSNIGVARPILTYLKKYLTTIAICLPFARRDRQSVIVRYRSRSAATDPRPSGSDALGSRPVVRHAQPIRAPR